MSYRQLLLVLALLMSQAALAVKDIHVVALFKDRAMVMVDGKRHLLRSGETSPEGVTLLSADSRQAVLEYHGERLQRKLDGRARAPAKKTDSGDAVRIFRDPMGMFTTVGSINGMPVAFLVDTGASSVAMNSAQARRLGLDFRVEGDSTYVATASSVTQAFRITLDRVKVGSIELRNVTGVVIDGPQPSEVLLGMSFLGRLDLVNQGNSLTLQKKY